MNRGSLSSLIGFAVLAACCLQQAVRAPAAESFPAWLRAEPNTIGRVDVAPWVTPDEPEAALAESAASVDRDFGAGAGRPADVVYRPIGVRVRVVRVLRGGRVALVHGIDARWQAYAPLERLVPEVPPGTQLTVAGGFGGFADLFPNLAAAERSPLPVVTGTRLRALETGVAPYDPESSDLVRLHVRVTSGNLRGRTGWIAVAYTGLPVRHLAARAAITAKACVCRLLHFDGAAP